MTKLCNWCDQPATHLLKARIDKSWTDWACGTHKDEYADGFEIIQPIETYVTSVTEYGETHPLSRAVRVF